MPILTQNSVPERRDRPGLREHHVEHFEWTPDPLVTRWLRQHIGGADKRFIAYLASKG